ncbi:hypothetical protein PTKIN_Ptkin14bG0211800 [Pterospermum kingtungense]
MNHRFLSELSKYEENQMIKIRIARIWDSINPKTGEVMSLDFLATDAKRSAIHVTIRTSEIETFRPLLKQGALYQISRFFVSKLKPTHNSVPGDHIITLIRNTHIQEIEDDPTPYPEHYFCFLTYHALNDRLNNGKFMADVIGALTSVGQSQNLEIQATKKRVDKQDIFIIDLSGQILRVTIWAELIREIKLDELLQMDNPILIFAGTTVKSYNGELYVASCSATQIYRDLDIPETRQLKKMHERIKVEILPSHNEPETREATIADLLRFNPETIHNVRFSCQAKVIDVDPSTGWFYNACNLCYKSLLPHGQSFHCANHGEKTPILIPKLNMIIEDKTGQMELVAFAKPAERLINSTVSEIATNGTLNKMILPEPVMEIIDREFIFQIGLTQQAIKQNSLAYKIFNSQVFMNKVPAQPTTETEATIQLSRLTLEKNQHGETIPSQHITNVPGDLFPEQSHTKKRKYDMDLLQQKYKPPLPHKVAQGTQDSGSHPNDVDWSLLWSSCTAPKVKQFWWRVVHDILPVNSKLRERSLPVDVRCSVCGMGEETVLHSILGCQFSHRVWSHLKVVFLQGLDLSLDSVQIWLKVFKRWREHEVLELAMCIGWFLWNNRYQCYHNLKCLTPAVLFSTAFKFHNEYLQANRVSGSPTRNDTAGWDPPPRGLLKLNAYSGYDRSLCIASCGVVVRDHDGATLLAAAKRFEGVYDVLQAELLPLHFGLQLTSSKNMKISLVESDSLLAIRQVKKKNSMSEWFALISDILNFASLCNVTEFQHVKRGANRLAHNVAKCCRSDGVVSQWVNSLPPNLCIAETY